MEGSKTVVTGNLLKLILVYCRLFNIKNIFLEYSIMEIKNNPNYVFADILPTTFQSLKASTAVS